MSLDISIQKRVKSYISIFVVITNLEQIFLSFSCHIWKKIFFFITTQFSSRFSSLFFSFWLSSNQTIERKLLFKFFSFRPIFQSPNTLKVNKIRQMGRRIRVKCFPPFTFPPLHLIFSNKKNESSLTFIPFSFPFLPSIFK